MRNVIYLSLKKQWFDLIKSGEKRIEYRKLGDFWKKRIFQGTDKPIPFAVFTLGYPKRTDKSRRLFARIDKVDIGRCPYEGWEGQDFYRIHFTLVKEEDILGGEDK